MSNPLLKELQELVGAGIIPEETAQRIRDYYQSKQDSSPNKFNIVLGLLGVILVSSGIVLLIAHNWDVLNKLSKTIIAFLPLAIGQGLCVYTLLRKKQNKVWQESSATVLFFAVATSISLVSQIYQIDGELSGFLLTWLFLMMPVIYLMNASIVSLLSIAGITWYACLEGYGYGKPEHPWMYVLFMIYIIPFYYRFARFYRNSNFYLLHNWFLALSICITLGSFSDFSMAPARISAGYIALFGLLYSIGRSALFSDQKLFTNPARIVGELGITVVLMIWSYDFFWESWDKPKASFFLLPFAYLIIVFLLGIIIFQIRRSGKDINPVNISVFVFCLAAFLFLDKPPLPSFLVNCCILGIAIFYIRKGSQQNHLGIMNYGLLIMAILAVLRFFDSSIPFVWRGMLFVLAGIGFFAANFMLLKKRKAVIQNNQP